MDDATEPLSDERPSVDASDSFSANAQSSITPPCPSVPKRTFLLHELSHYLGPRLSAPQVVFVRVINTPDGPQMAMSKLKHTTFDSLPLHLRRTILIREEYTSSETCPPEIPETIKYSHTVFDPPGGENLQADIKPVKMNPIAQGLDTGGTLGVAWAVLRAAWCASDPLYKDLRLRDRLSVMSQGQGLRVATLAAAVCGLHHLALSAAGTNDYSLPQMTADAANGKLTVPQIIQVKQPIIVGTTFTYLGALAGVLASTYKLHRHAGPRIGAVQQIVGGAAIGWYWAALGQARSRLHSFQETNGKVRGEIKGQKG